VTAFPSGRRGPDRQLEARRPARPGAGRKANALVGDGDGQLRVLPVNTHRDGSGAMLWRVRDQIVQRRDELSRSDAALSSCATENRTVRCQLFPTVEAAMDFATASAPAARNA
jgi:hypothetical protein